MCLCRSLGMPRLHLFRYEDEEKEEFMFKLMKAVAIGGPLCQYDDNWDDYLKTTKVCGEAHALSWRLLFVVCDCLGALPCCGVLVRWA